MIRGTVWFDKEAEKHDFGIFFFPNSSTPWPLILRLLADNLVLRKYFQNKELRALLYSAELDSALTSTVRRFAGIQFVFAAVFRIRIEHGSAL